MDIIRNNCDFDFHFNNTEITPTVLDGGDEISLAHWPNVKHLICNINVKMNDFDLVYILSSAGITQLSLSM